MRRISIYIALVVMALAATSAFAQTPPYNRTIIVQSTGNPSADGASLLAAIAGIAPPPSANNQWVVQLEGGVYDVGTSQIVLQPYLNLQGAGARVSTVRGSFQPPGGLQGGLIEAASFSEVRDLTVHCISSQTVPDCQAVSMHTVSPHLTDLRLLVTGSGTGNHWGIRAFDSQPRLERVEISVQPSAGNDSYGIVYTGTSRLLIERSTVAARGGTQNNWAILSRGDLLYSTLSDSTVSAIGGNESAGIRYLSFGAPGVLLIDNTEVTSLAATLSIGIGDNQDSAGSPRIFFRSGRLYGQTHGFSLSSANVDFVNTEVFGNTAKISANNVKIGSTWLRGSGFLFGQSSIVCAGTFNDAYTFYPSTCPP